MDFLLTVGIFSIPHIFYYYVWTKSKHFMKMVRTYAGQKKDYVEAFSQIAYAIKLVQFTALAIYFFSLGAASLGDITAPRFLLGGALFAAGQYLNAAVYKAIGVNGVYYGTRLGKTVPWYTGFPFDSVPHPQYLGSALSMWGLALVLFNAPHHAPLLAIAAFVSAFYAFSSWVEATM